MGLGHLLFLPQISSSFHLPFYKLRKQSLQQIFSNFSFFPPSYAAKSIKLSLYLYI